MLSAFFGIGFFGRGEGFVIEVVNTPEIEVEVVDEAVDLDKVGVLFVAGLRGVFNGVAVLVPVLVKRGFVSIFGFEDGVAKEERGNLVEAEADKGETKADLPTDFGCNFLGSGVFTRLAPTVFGIDFVVATLLTGVVVVVVVVIDFVDVDEEEVEGVEDVLVMEDFVPGVVIFGLGLRTELGFEVEEEVEGEVEEVEEVEEE